MLFSHDLCLVFIQAPRQPLTEEEKATIKAEDIPKDWQNKPAKLAQKDRYARWIMKHGRAKGDKGISFAASS